MSNKIGDFKSAFQGGTRANRFSVSFGWPSVVTTVQPDTTVYHAMLAKLPESDLGSISVPYRGRVAHFAGDRDYKPWTVTMVDDTGSNASWKAFQGWSNALSRHNTNTSADKTYAAGTLLKDITFKQLALKGIGDSPSDISTDNILRKFTLKHAWPSEVGQIGLDMGEGGNLVTFTVTFTYDYYTIDFGI